MEEHNFLIDKNHKNDVKMHLKIKYEGHFYRIYKYRK